MKSAIENLVKKLIFFIYPKVFGETPGRKAMDFMKNLSFIFIGIAISKVFSVFFQIYTGRILGPVEYGKYTMVISLSNFFWIPMILGLAVALVKYLAEDRSDEEKRKIISTSINLVLLLTAATALVILLLSDMIGAMTDVTQKYVIAATLVSIALSLWTMGERIWRGLDKMKKVSLVNIVMNCFFLVGTLIATAFLRTALVPIAATALGYIIASSFALPELRKYYTPRIDTKWARTLLKYGLITICGTIPYAINTNINKIFINIFLTLGEVGFYQAYSFSTLNVASFFITTFVIVFFPVASREKDKKNIFGKMNRMIKMSPVLYVIVMGLAFIILFLYGSAYSIILPLVALFSLAAVVDINFFIHTWFSSSMGIEGVKNTSYMTALTSAIGVTMAYILIPAFGIYGAIVSTLVSFFIGTIFIRYRIRRQLS